MSKKTALVCASSRGIGKAIARQLAEDGFNIVLNGRREEELKETASELEKITEVLSICTDISQSGSEKKLIEKTIEKFGNIHVLINNIGGPKPGKFIDKTVEDWSQAFNDLFLSNVRITKEVLPFMLKNNWGRIVNITSITAKEPSENLILSNPLRAAIISVGKSLSVQYAANNILVNSVCPASILTERTEFLLSEKANSEGKTYNEVLDKITETMPMKRLQTPEEVAAIVAFLCSEKASGITGTTISVDGGNSKFMF